MPGVTLLKHRTWSFAFQEHGGVTKEPGARISAVRSMYTICETALRWTRCWGLCSSHFTPHTPHLTLPASHLERRTSSVSQSHTSAYHLTLPTSCLLHSASHLGPSLTIPHASSASHYPLRVSHSLPHTTHFERRPVATNDCSGKYAVFSGAQSSGPGPAGALGAPVNDNHYRYRLQTGTSMIIVVIYIYKPKWEWLSIVLVNENDYHYPMANDN